MKTALLCVITVMVALLIFSSDASCNSATITYNPNGVLGRYPSKTIQNLPMNHCLRDYDSSAWTTSSTSKKIYCENGQVLVEQYDSPDCQVATSLGFVPFQQLDSSVRIHNGTCQYTDYCSGIRIISGVDSACDINYPTSYGDYYVEGQCSVLFNSNTAETVVIGGNDVQKTLYENTACSVSSDPLSMQTADIQVLQIGCNNFQMENIYVEIFVNTQSTTASPTDAPTQAPTQSPTDAPTDAPTQAPTDAPTGSPTDAPTDAPTQSPTGSPTEAPTQSPTDAPTDAPTQSPTGSPTEAPTQSPTDAPTDAPTQSPTGSPTDEPTQTPTATPTHICYVDGEEEPFVDGFIQPETIRDCTEDRDGIVTLAYVCRESEFQLEVLLEGGEPVIENCDPGTSCALNEDEDSDGYGELYCRDISRCYVEETSYFEGEAQPEIIRDCTEHRDGIVTLVHVCRESEFRLEVLTDGGEPVIEKCDPGTSCARNEDEESESYGGDALYCRENQCEQDTEYRESECAGHHMLVTYAGECVDNMWDEQMVEMQSCPENYDCYDGVCHDVSGLGE